MADSLLIKNATVVTMDAADRVFGGDVLIEGSRIVAIGPLLTARADEVIDASRRVLLPGLVQTHVHLCQTLFRTQSEPGRS